MINSRPWHQAVGIVRYSSFKVWLTLATPSPLPPSLSRSGSLPHSFFLSLSLSFSQSLSRSLSSSLSGFFPLSLSLSVFVSLPILYVCLLLYLSPPHSISLSPAPIVHVTHSDPCTLYSCGACHSSRPDRISL